MAENKELKKTPAKGASTASDRMTPAKGKGTVTATAASKAPAKKKSATTSKTAASKKVTGKTAAGKSAAKKPEKRDDGQQTARIKRRSTFSEQFLPYIFAGLALIFSVFLVLNALGDAETAADHPAGFVGFYFCQVLFGCFGWAAYLIPLLFVNLAVFWRRYCEENLVAVKVILSILLMIMISAVIHVGVCTKDPAMAEIYAPDHLYRTGAVFESGGVVGGLVGFALYAGLKLPGTVALAVVALPLMVMLLVGVTPAYVFGKLWAALKAWREKSAEEKALRREEKEAQAEADRKAATQDAYREKRARMDADRRRTEEKSDDQDGENGEETAPAVPDPKNSRNTARRVALVDTETGEMLEEETEAAPVPDAPTASADDEDLPRLSFYEPTPDPAASAEAEGKDQRYDAAEVDWKETDADDGFVAKEFTDRGARPVAAATPATAEALVDDGEAEFYDGTPDAMDTDLEEEAPAAPATVSDLEEDDEEELTAADELPPAGNFSVVYSAEEKPKEGVMVTINKQEFSAVAESGLSEEELVLSTAHAPAELPAEPAREYRFPSVDMLTRGSSRYEANDAEIAENTRLLREVLESFHIRVKEISCSCGPTITRFEVKPDTGIRVRSIANLVDDIAMNLAKAGVRIEAPIPGKAAVGIEVPNAEPATVYLRNILETPEFRNHKSRIAACLGADVSGRPVILDINKMPHLLIAGATGMGKSVCINSIIMSILYKAKPDEVKLILIDPKKVEFAMYRELPHLFCPIVSDPKQAAGTLYCAVNEMERRFGLIEEVGVRNLAGYNEITADDPERPALPQIVIIIDELADLMMTAPADVETAICRLAQKARAAGIHLVIGTQRPSVDVITGLIKANVPSRIAFTVASSVDSRTIIDTVGADKLIGRGDMLYAPVGVNKPMRCQGTFVSESEVERVVTFIKENNEPVEYDDEFVKNIAVEAARCGVNKKKGEQVSIDDFDGLEGGNQLWGEDPIFWKALDTIVSKEKFGTSALQRALHLGYGRAAALIDKLEEYGFVGPDPGNKTGRDVRITHEQLADYKANGLPGHRGGDGD
ncbi:MAG: DNA translocase FtsK 4TM domain-containing protein [Clostridia bacterium]|nr:DNA translocase FtsK 4TM domain-containing protein [Clostridia bacterium]